MEEFYANSKHCKPCYLARGRAWRAANRERARVIAARSMKKARAKDPEKYRAKDQERRKSGAKPARCASKNREVSARRRAAARTALAQRHRNWLAAIYATAVDLGLEVDHVIPLKGAAVCGLHVPWNMQILSRNRNAAKGNRLAA